MPPLLPPLSSSDPVAQESHGRSWGVNHRIEKRDLNGPIPHCKWYIIDAVGERIIQSDYTKVKKNVNA